MDPIEYYGCVGVLIPSLRIIDSRTLDLVARPCLFLPFSRFSSSVSFPSFGINNAQWRLFCHFFFSPVVFSQVATAGDSAGDPGFPKRVPPSFCRLLVSWVFILLYSYLFFSLNCFILLHCVHMIVVSVGSVGLVICWGGLFYER